MHSENVRMHARAVVFFDVSFKGDTRRWQQSIYPQSSSVKRHMPQFASRHQWKRTMQCTRVTRARQTGQIRAVVLYDLKEHACKLLT